MTKTCKDCGEIKAFEFFYASKTHLDGKMSYCKECHKKRSYKWRKNNLEKFNKTQRNCYYKKQDLRKRKAREYHHKGKDGRFHVYLLPESHYCGKTNNLLRRLREQKSSHNRFIQGAEIVMSFDREEDALRLENCFHRLGWYGGDSTFY